MKRIIVFLIRFYQKYLSLDQGYFGRFVPTKVGHCVFYPTCSEYMLLSIEKYGLAKGLIRGAIRILRCHPWQRQHVDIP